MSWTVKIAIVLIFKKHCSMSNDNLLQNVDNYYTTMHIAQPEKVEKNQSNGEKLTKR